MNRTSLDFLNPMFPFENKDELNILIINQTEIDSELKSNFKNIRVVNCYEKGLSRSRNLAIENALGEICLISDDDTRYISGFQEIIKDAFKRHKEVSLIKFKIETFDGKPYKSYPIKSKELKNYSNINTVSSIEIAFRRNDINTKKIRFNELFGLGSLYKSGEEFLFLRDVLNKHLKIYFDNHVIVKHSSKSSTVIGSDDYVMAQSVIYFIVHGNISKLYVLKLLFFLFRRGHIKMSDLVTKYTLAKKAIVSYKKVINS